MSTYNKELFAEMTYSANLFEDMEDDERMAQTAWSGPFCPPNRQAYRPYIAYLCSRILLGHAGFVLPLDRESPSRRNIADLIGVPEIAQKELQAEAIHAALVQAHASGVVYPPSSPTPPTGAMHDVADCPLKRNLEWIVQTAQLSAVETRVFELAVLMRVFPSLAGLLAEAEHRSVSDHYYTIAALLNVDPLAVKDALQTDSVLMRCALVKFWSHGGSTLDSFLRAPQNLVHKMEHHTGEAATLLGSFILPLQDATLDLSHFEYTQANTRLAQAWLAGALASAARRQGSCHLLVTGAPGLGKTEWVRALLHEAHAQAMELAVFNDQGVPLTGAERLRNLMMGMHFMQHTAHGVLVFDEADDVFSHHYDSASDEQGEDSSVAMRNNRASLNQLLENSRLPVIWIMNEPEVLDPAVLRRFDAVIQFESMPRIPKLRLLQEHFGDDSDADNSLPTAELQRWADIRELTPALISRLASVRTRAKEAGQPLDLSDCRQWLMQRLSQRATRVLRSGHSSELPWSAQTVNASMDLTALIQGIQNYPHARVLLHGLPGTGKTAYAHALAQALGRPLQEQRSSDLLSAFVGGTEAQISEAFARAHMEDSVLFLDEADSLLASRESATRSWEVTQVNELLVQLHAFDGIVVLATNRLDDLDTALLRRMDAKVEFLPLELHQSVDLLLGVIAAALEGQPLDSFMVGAGDMAALRRLHPLTPGDFAVLRRRIRFARLRTTTPAEMASEIIALLAIEVRHKTGGRQAMGFTSNAYSGRDVSNSTRAPRGTA